VAPVLAGLIVPRFAHRVGIVWLGIVSLGLLVMNAGFVPDTLVHPESPADFVPISMLTVGGLVAVIATIPAYLQAVGHPSSWRTLTLTARIAIAAIAAAVAGSLTAASRVTSDAPAGGSTAVTIEDFSFAPKTIGVSSGKVLLYLTNSDAARHTFTVDELAVDVSIAPGQSKVVELDAPAGVYSFYCKPHAGGMEGELVVS
jgi:plastocyanin